MVKYKSKLGTRETEDYQSGYDVSDMMQKEDIKLPTSTAEQFSQQLLNTMQATGRQPYTAELPDLEPQYQEAELIQDSFSAIELPKMASQGPDVTYEQGDYWSGVALGLVGSIDYDKIANVESGGDYNAQNPFSSAYGKYQFIDGTRLDTAKSMGVSDAYLKSPKGQEEGMQYFTNNNKRILEKNDIPVNTLTAYAMHQQGSGGGIKLLKDTMSAKQEELVVSNTPEKYRTGNPREDWMKAYTAKLI